MGQYYHPMLIDSEGKISILNPHQYDNGVKLMEHSYIGNKLMNAVLGMIKDNPMRVAWIGDYSAEYYGEDAYEKKMLQDEFMTYYKAAWDFEDRDYDTAFVHPDPMELDVKDAAGWYLVNHTQGIYIDMGAYVTMNMWIETGKDYRTGETREWDVCVHPLSLLTACGNDRGGGDYHNCYPSIELVGTWAFDEIELRQDMPLGYKEAAYIFTEQIKTA